MVSIAVALFEDAEELDFAGPWEVLARLGHPVARRRSRGVHRRRRRPSRSRARKACAWCPTTSGSSAPGIDVLVYPGGRGSRRELADPAVLERLRKLREEGTLMTSVCTGALVFAAAGLLRDRPATTWWGSLEHARGARPDDRGAPRRPVRRQRRDRHRGRRLGRDRHGAAPRRATPFRRPGARGAGGTSSTTRRRRCSAGTGPQGLSPATGAKRAAPRGSVPFRRQTRRSRAARRRRAAAARPRRRG